jgi:DNA (cytosine-5)-methyltransferase 1
MSTKSGIKEIANQLGISEQRVRSLCRTGQLKAEKISGAWIIDADSAHRYGLKTAHVVAEDHPNYNVTRKSLPIALSFFSGAMGLDLGVERAGFDIKLACEVDKYCRQTIALNRPKMAIIGDINDYSPQDVLAYAGLDANAEIDLIMGGPPCQAFSTAGKRQGFQDDRGNVFLKYLDIALALRPKYLVIENVRGLLSCPMSHRPHDQRGDEYPDLALDELPGGALNFILSRLRAAAYTYSFNLYNAANFGTPQVRERVIIICSRDGEAPPFLVPTHTEDASYGLPAWRTFREAVKGIRKHTHLNFPEKRLQYYRMLSAGQNWRNLPEKLQQEALGKSYYAGGGKTGFLRRLAWDKPSPTLVTHPAMPATDLAHPQEDRPLSIEEYKRIQEFPDNWMLAGPLIAQYKQVGNAVPGSLGYALGKLIQQLLNGEAVTAPSRFEYSRYKNTHHEDWEREFALRIRNQEPAALQCELQLG